MSITRTAPAPTRATTTVVLNIPGGLLTLPLSVFTAVESTSVVRQEFMDGDPDVSVGRLPYRRDTGAVIDSGAITRMAAAEDGTLVVLDNAEMAEAAGLAGGCEVITFVPIKDAGQYLVDGLYQVRPKSDRKGGAAAAAAFALLLAGMTARKVHALVKVKLRDTQHYALLTADGDLLLLATADSIRGALPMPEAKPTKAQVAMATQLIDAVGVSTPTIVDDWSPKVQAYVNEKAKTDGRKPSNVTAPAPTGDVVAVLEASIKAAKAARKAS